MVFNIAGETDVGMVRANNEDSFSVIEKIGLLVVADGMGGHASGEVASKMAIDVIQDYFSENGEKKPFVGEYCDEYSEEANRLGSAIRLANMAIHDVSENNSQYHGMGTTVAAVLVNGRKMSIAHVGDSRVYLIRAGDIEQLTDDHSLVYEQVKKEIISKEDAETSGMRNILTRALGTMPEVEVDISEMNLIPGDKLLLCSDGLYTMVPDDDIMAVVTAANMPAEACQTLIRMANDNGGKDNITVVTAHFCDKKWYTPLLNFMKRFRR